MNINAKHGDKVRYIGASNDQINWGGCADPRGILKKGELYVVDLTEIHSWHTKVVLIGEVGKFPSVAFEDA